MSDEQSPFDDEFGPDPDRPSGGKPMGIGGGGGSSGFAPYYEEALHILGLEHEIPPPFIQQALVMTNDDAIDLAALLSALQSGKIVGAGLDVFETEPLPSDSPFWDLNNIILSPHCSAVHDQWEQDSFDLFLDNLQNWENDDPLFNIVDPNRGY